jgi:hypothetical protein
MKQKAIVIATMILAAVAGALLPLAITAITVGGIYLAVTAANEAPDPREEYYRAMYDVCVAQTGLPELCLDSVAGYVEKHWYEDPSIGWQWPLPGSAPAPTPAPRPSSQGLQG